jgi:phage-related protein
MKRVHVNCRTADATISRPGKTSVNRIRAPAHRHLPILQKCNTIKTVTWIVELLDARVRDELEALPADMKARFRRIVELIQGYGLEQMREPHVKHLEGPLWEMRMRGKDGMSRAIYITAKGRRVVVVRVFVKKSRKTPRAEIVLAWNRAREVTE